MLFNKDSNVFYLPDSLPEKIILVPHRWYMVTVEFSIRRKTPNLLETEADKAMGITKHLFPDC